MVPENWSCPGIHLLTREHFYHGRLRTCGTQLEALITNLAVGQAAPEPAEATEQLAFFEQA